MSKAKAQPGAFGDVTKDLLELLSSCLSPLFEEGDEVIIQTNSGDKITGRVIDANISSVIVDESPDDPDNPTLRGVSCYAIDTWRIIPDEDEDGEPATDEDQGEAAPEDKAA